MNTNIHNASVSSVRAYAAPQLTVFGAMAELTAGGASGVTENKSGGSGENCGSVTTKRC